MTLQSQTNYDYVIFDNIGDNMIYKSYESTDLRTFISCKYNYRYDTEDDEEYATLDNRQCVSCGAAKPFSYGSQSTECHPCSHLEGYVAYTEEYLQYFYI